MMMTFILPDGAKAEKIRIKIEEKSYEKRRQGPGRESYSRAQDDEVYDPRSKGREDKNKVRKATRSEGRCSEERASRFFPSYLLGLRPLG